MANLSRDGRLALEIAMLLTDGRDPKNDMAAILVTLETVVATVLLAVMDRNPRAAVGMLHEGLVPRTEERIAQFSARGAL